MTVNADLQEGWLARFAAGVRALGKTAGPAKPGPPLSVRGAVAALRPPTAKDLLFSAKAATAVTLSLLIGFSQGLENPYWSAVTVYVLVSPPQAGAIRSKALFRLLGTSLGGTAAIMLASLFGANVGGLLIATVVTILLACYVKTLDRTPFSYTWVSMSLTLAVMVLPQVQSPETIFLISTTRVVEIGLAILMIGLIDSIVLPQTATPAFVQSMAIWRGHAADWATSALAEDALQDPASQHARRVGFRTLAGLLGPLDAAGAQLPYDTVPVPPRARDLRFVRLTVAHLIARLAAANVWIEVWRRAPHGMIGGEQLIVDVKDWLSEQHAFADPKIVEHATSGANLIERLHDAEAGIASGDWDELLHAATLRHLRELTEHWCELERALHALATGRQMPRSMVEAAKCAAPVRSTDYLIGLLDISPLAIALIFTAAVWYATAWASGAIAMLIAYITLVFILGTPGVVQSARGITVWIAAAFVLTFLYQFAILPRVTSFPVLIAVLAFAIVPFGVLMAMSPAGMLIIVTAFTFLGLQNAYAADFGLSLETLVGSMAGCLIAIVSLHLCQFDRPRFIARRLSRALRRDVVDAARAQSNIKPDRLLSLGVDRIGLYLGIVGGLPENDPLQAEDPVDALRIAINVVRLREHERALSPAAQEHVRSLRLALAAAFANLSTLDRPFLLSRAEAAADVVLDEPPGQARVETLEALTGLRVSFLPTAVTWSGLAGAR